MSLSKRLNPRILQRSRTIPSDKLYTTIITVEEQMRGWRSAIREASSNPTSPKLAYAYEGLQDAVGYFNVSNILGFNAPAQALFAELRRTVRIGSQDLKIASIAIVNHGILVTRNCKDFEKVPGLVFEDWTLDS